MGKVYVGTVGLKLTVETKLNDLATATVIKLLVRKPDGTQVEWPSSYEGTAVTYITQPGDLDQSGLYSVQAYVEYPDGSKFYGETDTLPVIEPFE